MGALIASLLAVGPAPAGAAEIETGDDNEAAASVKPDYKACVGDDALDDAGFTDLGSLEAAVADINCLAYYEITTGRTADTFDPNSNVRRSNMALFLYRAAGKVGVDLMGGDSDADFGDIAELGEDRQNAIKALARNGILPGRGDMAFEPHADITRAEMAEALINLLRHASSDLFNEDGSLKIDDDDLDYFADARAAVPRSVDAAISYAYELGITTGRDDATFGPNDGVPRRNMATFIIRTMNHTNTRPAGVSAQSDGEGGIRVSVRTADFQPVPNAVVDVFSIAAARADEMRNSNGTCSRLGSSVSGTQKCQIDGADESTDLAGNLVPSGSVDASKGAAVWAWTGEAGDTVDADTDLFRLDIPPEPLAALPDDVKVTTSRDVPGGMGATFKAPYGSTVTYTLQLRADVTGLGAVDVGPGKDGASYRVRVVYPDDSVTSKTYKFNSEGTVTFEVSFSDPSKDSGDTNMATVTVDEPKGSVEGLHEPGVPTVTFSDTQPRAASIAVMTDGYGLAPARGSTTNTIIVIVTDEFGNGVSGVPVRLRAVDVDNGVHTNPDPAADAQDDVGFRPRSGVTVSSGMVQIGYTYSGNSGATQLFEAYVPATVSTSDDRALNRAQAAAASADPPTIRNFDVSPDTNGSQPYTSVDKNDDNDAVDDGEIGARGDRREIEYDDPEICFDTDPDEDSDEDGTDTNDCDIEYPEYGDEALQSAAAAIEARPERKATTFYWAEEGDDTHAGGAGNGDVVGGNLENNEIVVTIDAAQPQDDPDVPTLIIFDSNDQFEVIAADGSKKFGLDNFVKALATDMDLDPTETGVHYLSWEDYDANDSAVVTGWRLNTSS